jgi:ABC-2 type transport system ATP-binding protein
MNDLSLLETRVLCTLVEKQHTGPDTYPLTLNALVSGCNQKTSRSPVMEATEPEVQATLDGLKRRNLVIESSGGRVARYAQNVDSVLKIPSQSVAILTGLLRGPQTPGELRINCERLHRFARSLRGGGVPAGACAAARRRRARWCVQLARLPGARENRWAHLPSGTPVNNAPGGGCGFRPGEQDARSQSRAARIRSDRAARGPGQVTSAIVAAGPRKMRWPEPMSVIVSVSTCPRPTPGFEALKHVNLDIRRARSSALLGRTARARPRPSTSWRSLRPSSDALTWPPRHRGGLPRGQRADWPAPQELPGSPFDTPRAAVNFSRGLFGRPGDPALVERVLRELALWDKRDNRMMTLSGGMKRRLLIAKALAHEPQILFLDEPTAGVDVELRQGMWQAVRTLRDAGVTIILTTHYIEEAELMADRIGVINKGEIILVEEKAELMRKLGKKQLTLQLHRKLDAVPPQLAQHRLALADGGKELVYTYDTQAEHSEIPALLKDLNAAGLELKDLNTSQTSLEDIFVDLVRRDR